MKRVNTDKDVDSLMHHFYLVILGIFVLLAIPLAIYAFYLERRLDTFQATLQHQPLHELEAQETDRGDLYHLTANPTEGQLVYVPAYSHIYHDDGKPNLLTITLSVRNTSLEHEIVVRSVRYFDTQGKQIQSYLEKPVRLPALGTTEVIIKRDDSSGGSGANFLVEWYADTPVTEPIIEAVMIDTSSQQGISFVRRGSVISNAVSGEQNGNE